MILSIHFITLSIHQKLNLTLELKSIFILVNFVPYLGPMGKDGMECPAYCPANCGMEEMMCPGGEDPNGCMMPESCMPSKGTILIICHVVLK